MLKLDKMPFVTLKNISDSVEAFRFDGTQSKRLEDLFACNEILYDAVRESSNYMSEHSEARKDIMKMYATWFGALQLALEDRQEKHWTIFEFPKVGRRAMSIAFDTTNMLDYGSSSDFVSPIQRANREVRIYLRREGFTKLITPSDIPKKMEENNEYLSFFLEKGSESVAKRLNDPIVHTEMVYLGNAMYKALDLHVNNGVTMFRKSLTNKFGK